MQRVLLRPFSGSGAIAVYDGIAAQYGADSFPGRVAAVLLGSSETTFYTVAVYFAAVRVKNTRYAIPAALAADCTAYAYANIHEEFMRGHVTIIGCPKLDAVDYSEKLTEIIRSNDIKSVTVLRMEVPCCGGLEHAAITALKNSGKFIPWNVVTFSTDGRILDR